MGQIISRSQSSSTRTDTRSAKTIKISKKKPIGLLDKEHNRAINMFGSFKLIDFKQNKPIFLIVKIYILNIIFYFKFLNFHIFLQTTS